MDGGRGRGNIFLSAHRCPEDDLLPLHSVADQIISVHPEKSPEFTCPGEAGYLDILSKEEEEDNDEGSISDWSEEDLSLHFSPSVILQSDDEEQEHETGCDFVDVTMETQVKMQKGEGLKTVPKRQIQLRRKTEDNVTDQVVLNNGSPHVGGVNNEHPRQDLLLRQHSMPIFQACTRTDADVDNYRVYRGLVSGASQGPPCGGHVPRLQKSLSLDETKTMMASCIIKNVLMKKMQVEQSGAATKDPEKKLAQPPPTDMVTGGGSALKPPVHVVRDMRSLVKHRYDLPFPTATTKPFNKKPTNFKMLDSKESPPPTYQQAVGVKGPVAMVTGSVSTSQTGKESDSIHRPIRGSVISSTKGGDVTCPVVVVGRPADPSEIDQSERAATLPSHSVFVRPLSAQDQNPVLGVSSESAAGFTQQILHPCFYTAPHLHPGGVGLIHGTVGYMPTQLHSQPPAPTLHLPRRPDDNQKQPTESCLKQQVWARTTGVQDGWGASRRASPEQQQPPFVHSLQGFSTDLIGPAAVLSLSPASHMMFHPRSGRSFYVDTPPPPQRKMLLDPETGQFFQVFLPAVGSAPTVLHVGGANHAVLMPFPPLIAVPSLYRSPCLPITVTTPAAP